MTRADGSASIGILALQGDIAAHEVALAARGFKTRPIRIEADLDRNLAGIVLPGGESSVMLKLAAEQGMIDGLRARLRELPVLATCAGLILLAELGLLDLTVERNGYGRQVRSGVYALAGRGGFPDCEGVFIRAPRVVRAGASLGILATRDGDPVLVRAGLVLGACFHPELSDDLSQSPHPAINLFCRLVTETDRGVSQRPPGP